MAQLLEDFFRRWTAPFCRDCLEVTRSWQPHEPRADVELVAGRFPGCCQAGVANDLRVPAAEGWLPLPAGMAAAIRRQRRRRGWRSTPGSEYALRERTGGRVVRGRGCGHLGAGGCRLGIWKAPLCLTYICDPILEALQDGAGVAAAACLGGGDPGGAAATLVQLGETPGRARAAVQSLGRRLAALTAHLEGRGWTDGEALLRAWLARAGGRPVQEAPGCSNPSRSTR